MEQQAIEVTHAFATRGDLAHLALFVWAATSTVLLLLALRELAVAARRFNDLVAEMLRIAAALRRD